MLGRCFPPGWPATTTFAAFRIRSRAGRPATRAEGEWAAVARGTVVRERDYAKLGLSSSVRELRAGIGP